MSAISPSRNGLSLPGIPPEANLSDLNEALSSKNHLEILNDPTCVQLMRDFIKAKPELWNEDIGVGCQRYAR